MPDIGWTELLVIAVLAIVFVGPKDLPRVLREFGKWTSAARRAAREFHSSLEEMAREAELDELTKAVESQGLTRQSDKAMADYMTPGESPIDPATGRLPPRPELPRSSLPQPGEPYVPPLDDAGDAGEPPEPDAKASPGT